LIIDEREYRSAQATAADLATSLAELYAKPPQRPGGFEPVVRGGLVSQLVEREAELADYEARLTGLNRVQAVDSLAELPALLVEARRARGWSERDLAERSGLTERQIAQAEASGYASVPLAQLLVVSAALGVAAQASVTLPPIAAPGPEAHPDRTAQAP
jgi:HTH-type transcriptional regulator/antitoxin HigA